MEEERAQALILQLMEDEKKTTSFYDRMRIKILIQDIQNGVSDNLKERRISNNEKQTNET
jgi:hypothetical protein